MVFYLRLSSILDIWSVSWSLGNWGFLGPDKERYLLALQLTQNSTMVVAGVVQLCFFIWLVGQSVALCSLGWPRTYYLAQAGFDLPAVLLPSLLKAVISCGHFLLQSAILKHLQVPLQPQPYPSHPFHLLAFIEAASIFSPNSSPEGDILPLLTHHGTTVRTAFTWFPSAHSRPTFITNNIKESSARTTVYILSQIGPIRVTQRCYGCGQHTHKDTFFPI